MHQARRGFEGAAQLVVRGLAEGEPRRDARLEQRLAHPHVPDAGDGPLNLERLAEAQVARERPQVAQHRIDVGRLGEDVGPEAQPRPVAQLEDRAVPEHRLVRRAAEDEPRPLADLPPDRLHAPASFHLQMAPQRDASLEPEEEVLADRLDRLEPFPVEPPGDVLDRSARVRRLDGDRLPDEHLQPARGAGERIALGHGLGPQHGAARACEEAGFEQQRHDLRLADGAPVEALDREPLRAAALDVVDERGERGTEPRLVGVAQRHERAAATLDEQRRLTAEQHDLRARHACRAGARALGPRQHGTVRLRRVGGREHERPRRAVAALPAAGAFLAQALDRARQRELRAAETFDEVAAAADAERLEVAQLPVDGAVPARDPFATDAVAYDDPLPLEQQLRERATLRAVGEEAQRGRPAPLRRGDVGAAMAREAARSRSLSLLGRVAPARAERRPGVVRHLARPDELPQRGQRRLGVELGSGKQVEPELGTPR